MTACVLGCQVKRVVDVDETWFDLHDAVDIYARWIWLNGAEPWGKYDEIPLYKRCVEKGLRHDVM